MNLRDLRTYLIELLGTFFIVVFTCMSYTEYYNEKMSLLSLAVTNGFIVSACTWAGMGQSQVHYNPVITLTQLLNRKMIFQKAIIYFGLQLFASIFGTLTVVLLSPMEKSQEIIFSFPYPTQKFLFSFLYVAMYFGLVINKKAPSNVFGFGIGGVQTIAILSIGTISGACINPVRFIGPSLLTEKIKYMTVYLSSQFIGGILAGFYFEFYLNKQKKSEILSTRSVIEQIIQQ